MEYDAQFARETDLGAFHAATFRHLERCLKRRKLRPPNGEWAKQQPIPGENTPKFPDHGNVRRHNARVACNVRNWRSPPRNFLPAKQLPKSESL